MGPAAVGFLCVGLGTYLMVNKKRNQAKLVAWLYLIGGGCLAVAGVGLIVRGVGWVIGMANDAGSALVGSGVGAAAGLLIAIILGWHAFADMKPKKNDGSPDKSTAFAALFFFPVIVGIGGIASAVQQTMAAGDAGWSSVSAILGG